MVENEENHYFYFLDIDIEFISGTSNTHTSQTNCNWPLYYVELFYVIVRLKFAVIITYV